jgi:biopolymer transport protein ExbB/biopolymer transport protein TolQ
MEVVTELWKAMAITGKLVVLLLAVLSIYSYGVMIDRGIALRWVRRRSAEFAAHTEDRLGELSMEEVLELATAPERRQFTSLASVLATALQEFKLLVTEAMLPALIMEGVDVAASRSIDVAALNLRARLSGLATIAAVAPFLGLFGTVTGLISAFRGIAATGSGGMATVSGGISEALVTTVVGLFVAMPALWAYNYFMNRVDVYSLELDNKAAKIIGHLVRRELLRSKKASEETSA